MSTEDDIGVNKTRETNKQCDLKGLIGLDNDLKCTIKFLIYPILR